MAERFVDVDRETRLLLPADMRDRIPENDLAQFVIGAVGSMELESVRVSVRWSGSRQFPPAMVLALLVYCYANGVSASQRIERATYRDIGVRYSTGDTHRDHDTICAFRRENGKLLAETLEQVLRLARQMGLVKVGTVAVDGTHIKANASKHKSVRYDRAGELERMLHEDVQELMRQAESADAEGRPDDQQLPEEIGRRERLRARMLEARRQLEQRAKEKAAESRGPEDSGEGSADGEREPVVPKGTDQINLTDAESALMRNSRRDSYEQAYNAQAVVDSEGSELVLVAQVIRTPCDANQLEPALASVPESVGTVQRVLADGGYVNAEAMERVGQKVDLYVAITSEDNSYRRYDYRPPKTSSGRKVTDPRLVAMREKVTSDEGKRIYGRRAASVEPVFGVLKGAMGLGQFLLRGLGKVHIKWQLACLAYNMRRMWRLAST